MTRNVPELIGSENEMYRSMEGSWKNNLRVASPGIIQSFDSITQTCTIQLTLREEVTKEDYTKEWINLPLLLDVPIVIPQCKGMALTFPIEKGDECLVIFLDSCMDSWFSSGGIQNQIEKRRHDLSDAVAIIGIKSQPNVIPNYSKDSCQLRNNEGTAYVELKGNNINLVGSTVNISAGKIVLDGITWDSHTHTCPDGETTGPH